MKPSEAIKPISYLKAHASEMIRDIAENQKTVIITHNGEAKVVVQDIHSYEQLQASLALLKILALSARDLEDNKTEPVELAFLDIRRKIKANRST